MDSLPDHEEQNIDEGEDEHDLSEPDSKPDTSDEIQEGTPRTQVN